MRKKIKKINIQASAIDESKSNDIIMYLISFKVPQIVNCLYAIYLTTAFLTISQVLCSESNNNNEPYSNHLRNAKIHGSGSGATSSSNLQKRSSYAVISQAMSETIGMNNEFGSEYNSPSSHQVYEEKNYIYKKEEEKNFFAQKREKWWRNLCGL